jgi:hypothetical protein
VKPTQDGWCNSQEGRRHGGRVSLRQFRTWFKNGLRYVQLPNGRILTKYEWIDSYLGQFEVKDDTAKEMAAELTEDLG